LLQFFPDVSQNSFLLSFFICLKASSVNKSHHRFLHVQRRSLGIPGIPGLWQPLQTDRQSETPTILYVTAFSDVYLKVLAERRLVVASCQSDLKHATLGRVGSETNQRPLATTAHSDTQAVALRHSKHPVDPGQVIQSVVEQHHAERWRVGLVVHRQNLAEDRLVCR